LKKDVLLIDSCSMVNLITNRDILHDVHEVEKPLRVRCNAGVRTTSLMGTLGSFPEPVWHDPNAVANILSLHMVKKYYWVTYDSEADDAFVITDEHGKGYLFTPTGNGLYAYCKNKDQDWIFLNTVEANKAHYSKRAYNDAVQARWIQDIIMCPSTSQYHEITARNLLPNSPVSQEDIAAAETIFSTSIGALKGKTVSQSGPATDGNIAAVPPEILKQFPHD